MMDLTSGFLCIAGVLGASAFRPVEAAQEGTEITNYFATSFAIVEAGGVLEQRAVCVLDYSWERSELASGVHFFDEASGDYLFTELAGWGVSFERNAVICVPGEQGPELYVAIDKHPVSGEPGVIRMNPTASEEGADHWRAIPSEGGAAAEYLKFQWVRDEEGRSVAMLQARFLESSDPYRLSLWREGRLEDLFASPAVNWSFQERARRVGGGLRLVEKKRPLKPLYRDEEGESETKVPFAGVVLQWDVLEDYDGDGVNEFSLVLLGSAEDPDSGHRFEVRSGKTLEVVVSLEASHCFMRPRASASVVGDLDGDGFSELAFSVSDVCAFLSPQCGYTELIDVVREKVTHRILQPKSGGERFRPMMGRECRSVSEEGTIKRLWLACPPEWTVSNVPGQLLSWDLESREMVHCLGRPAQTRSFDEYSKARAEK